ncbi:uncharacterized protein LOC131152959 [Malania oleifera]|uniref:uncharacterized protein LOC131152959 n=1 Tax=Malania oleifera TaxID=397392 RepID=UPI0025AE719F|nr:uncharacterized protein LOC131152959 [Malania oleifera]
MADVVQYRLERMLNELDDLERRGLFTRLEIAEIVKQRRKFEYRLKRPSPLKQDFLAYINYEKQLDALRLLRKKAMARELKKKGNKKMKKSLSDFAGVSRIIEIYRLAVMRFKGDVDLWFQYLEFCRERRNGRMRKALAQLIRFHPKVPGVWIYAAAWEFDCNLNVTAARALMQSGLRVCQTSEDLWVEYLRMELTYINKLKARKVALGEDEGTLTRDHADTNEKQWREENKDLFMSLDERESDDLSNVQNEESKMKLDVFQEQSLSILRTIYSGAVEALPSSLGLRKRFFEIVKAINLGHSEEMQKEILDDMKKDFAVEPEYWDWLARLEITDLESKREMGTDIQPCQLHKAVQVYEEALKQVPSSMMFNLYINFFMDVLPKGEAKSSTLLSASGHTVDYISYLLEVFERAEAMGCLTEDLACQHISVCLQLKTVDEARRLAEKLCCGKLSNAVQLWLLRISIEMKCVTKKSPSPSKADLLSIFELLRNVLIEASISEVESLWLMALKFFASKKMYFEKLVEISMASLAKHGGSECGFSLSSAIVNFVLQKNGIQHAREMYKRFLALPHPGLALYRNCIELELNLASIGDKGCLVNARKLYESALTTYDQDVSLWQDYYSMEIKMGTSETASAVCWRARKTLKDATAFVASVDL